MVTQHATAPRQRRAGKPGTLSGYMWANTTYAYGTYQPPTVTEPEAFATAWVFDYLAGEYAYGLCDDCGQFDPEEAAAIVVREALENRAAEADHRTCRAPRDPALTAEHLAHVTLRLVAACEAEVTAQESAREPWRWVLAAHANECPVALADADDDAYTRHLANFY